MRKLILFVILILLTFQVKSQIIKDNIPEDISSVASRFGWVNKTQTEYSNSKPNNSEIVKYYTYNQVWDYNNLANTKYHISFYNLDYSVYKKIEFNYSADSVNYPVENDFIQFVTTNTFNNDDLIEFVICFRKMENNKDVYYYYLKNENFETIYSFGNEMPLYTFKDAKGQEKIFAQKPNGILKNTYSIYTINKDISQGIKQSKVNNQSPFPNPAKQIVNLPYQLESGQQTTMTIYDINGKQICNKQINSTFDKIQLDVSVYQKGMYVYKYNGKSGKFLVE